MFFTDVNACYMPSVFIVCPIFHYPDDFPHLCSEHLFWKSYLMNPHLIKNKIEMINKLRKYPKKQYDILIGLLLIIVSCLLFSTSRAGICSETTIYSNQQLTAFEGYYQLDKNKDLYLQIMVKNNQLILKQLWDDQEIPFEQKSALYFYNDQRSFPLTFSKNTNGEITQVLAFERDTWIKVKNYKPVVKKEITLSAEKMQAFAGKYKMSDDGREAFLQFTVNGDALEVKELWSGKIFTIVPESELVFFARKGNYPVQFSKDKNGNITQALIFNKDVWVKVKE